MSNKGTLIMTTVFQGVKKTPERFQGGGTRPCTYMRGHTESVKGKLMYRRNTHKQSVKVKDSPSLTVQTRMHPVV